MKSSSEGCGSVLEMEDLSKRIERLGQNSTDDYKHVNITDISGQPSNLENGTFSSADRSKQHQENDEVPIPGPGSCICKHCQLRRAKERRMGMYTGSATADDNVHSTPEYKSYLKNLSSVTLNKKVVESENGIKNLMDTANNLEDRKYTLIEDSSIVFRHIDSPPTSPFADGLEQHHGSEKGLNRYKCKWKPYHKSTPYERDLPWHMQQ